MPVSAAEQHLLELINRGRLDPLAEADRYGIDLNEGLSAGQIDGQPLQVLAHNNTLALASQDHSEWMLELDVFSHTGDGGSSAGKRMASAGYQFEGTWQWAENLAWSGTTGTLDMEAVISTHHEGLFLSSGYRVNTFSANVRGVGLAQVQGDYVFDGVTYHSSMLTQNFALSGYNIFITGVAYRDTDGDDFYSIGEGLSGVLFETDDEDSSTQSAGGYAMTSDDDSTAVTISHDGETVSTLTVDTSDGNAKLDLIIDTRGDYSVAVSTDTTLVTGLDDATLLGAGHINLVGHGGDNTLLGNSGKNKLTGGAGDDVLKGNGSKDKLYGGSGDDSLNGGGGNDVLNGGSGDDRLKGGGRADKFIFTGGSDLIRYFKDDVDTIQISHALIDGSHDIDDLLDRAEIINGNAVFDLDGPHQLTVKGITDLDDLRNNLIIS